MSFTVVYLFFSYDNTEQQYIHTLLSNRQGKTPIHTNQQNRQDMKNDAIKQHFINVSPCQQSRFVTGNKSKDEQ